MPPSNFSWSQILEMLIQGKDLSDDQAIALMNAWLAEDLTAVQTGAFLSALRTKGLKGSELSSMASVLRKACHVPCSIPSMPLVDTCGTGGDGADTFNISTAVAFTSAACGANVAKHGNRSASGSVGSADVLEGIGIPLSAPLEKAIHALKETNITFLFAPIWHPALVNLAPLRKSLGVRTVFNLLGPLVNPLNPKFQVLGVAKQDLLDPMSDALNRLGLSRAIVVHGPGGLDEASLSGLNQLRLVKDGSIEKISIDPKSLGLIEADDETLKGGSLETNIEILTSVLKGKGTIPQRDVVALNTALVLWSANIENDLEKGVQIALNCLNNGLPWKKLESLKNYLSN